MLSQCLATTLKVCWFNVNMLFYIFQPSEGSDISLSTLMTAKLHTEHGTRRTRVTILSLALTFLAFIDNEINNRTNDRDTRGHRNCSCFVLSVCGISRMKIITYVGAWICCLTWCLDKLYLPLSFTHLWHIRRLSIFINILKLLILFLFDNYFGWARLTMIVGTTQDVLDYLWQMHMRTCSSRVRYSFDLGWSQVDLGTNNSFPILCEKSYSRSLDIGNEPDFTTSWWPAVHQMGL